MSLSSMDAGAVDLGLACAWYGPEGTMISNEDVKKLCEACHGGWATVGVATLRRCRALKCGNIASGREYTAGFFLNFNQSDSNWTGPPKKADILPLEKLEMV